MPQRPMIYYIPMWKLVVKSKVESRRKRWRGQNEKKKLIFLAAFKHFWYSDHKTARLREKYSDGSGILHGFFRAVEVSSWINVWKMQFSKCLFPLRHAPFWKIHQRYTTNLMKYNDCLKNLYFGWIRVGISNPSLNSQRSSKSIHRPQWKEFFSSFNAVRIHSS